MKYLLYCVLSCLLKFSLSYGICGQRPMDTINDMEGRIIGGQDSKFGEVPWQVMVKESKLFGLFSFRKCGGVLISNKWIITAAHCRAGLLGSLVAVVGHHNIVTWAKDPRQKKFEVSIRKTVIHPKFDRSHLKNDIALLELREPVDFGFNIQPICLTEPEDDFRGQIGLVSGWGLTGTSSFSFPQVLQIVEVPIIPNESCERMYKKAGYRKSVRPGILCAGYEEGGKDSCGGDSGGPLMLKKHDRWVLVGIVSNGIKCALPNLPGIYTEIAHYLEWIKSTTNQDFSLIFSSD